MPSDLLVGRNGSVVVRHGGRGASDWLYAIRVVRL